VGCKVTISAISPCVSRSCSTVKGAILDVSPSRASIFPPVSRYVSRYACVLVRTWTRVRAPRHASQGRKGEKDDSVASLSSLGAPSSPMPDPHLVQSPTIHPPQTKFHGIGTDNSNSSASRSLREPANNIMHLVPWLCASSPRISSSNPRSLHLPACRDASLRSTAGPCPEVPLACWSPPLLITKSSSAQTQGWVVS
jgi:hypothetical protein